MRHREILELSTVLRHDSAARAYARLSYERRLEAIGRLGTIKGIRLRRALNRLCARWSWLPALLVGCWLGSWLERAL